MRVKHSKTYAAAVARNNHRHDWVDQGRRQWRYRCSICGAHSQNNLVQPLAFREPLVVTSTYMDFTKDTPTMEVFQWELGRASKGSTDANTKAG